jgi:hypothetical protein
LPHYRVGFKKIFYVLFSKGTAVFLELPNSAGCGAGGVDFAVGVGDFAFCEGGFSAGGDDAAFRGDLVQGVGDWADIADFDFQRGLEAA